ncbi:MAG: 50S ribosomal protein L9 [Planctomycetes bacterium]|nr:50S ribosomal protein L9 [Planctomycetota bacterium]
MKVILRERVETLGRRGEIVEVADGYARNYLIPYHIAVKASRENIRKIEEERKEYLAREAKRIEDAQEIASVIAKLQLTVTMNAHEDGTLYGSVSERTIVDALKEERVTITAQMVRMKQPIREVGRYMVPLHLHPEVDGEVSVWVVAEEAPKHAEPTGE